MQLVKHLKGHSGASISLYDDNNTYKVVKNNFKNAKASAFILDHLPFNTPQVYSVTSTRIEMEYINGLDMATFLTNASKKDIYKLIDFLFDYINYCLNNSNPYNFKKEPDVKIQNLKPFINLNELKKDYDYCMPESLIHGDFTLENIIFFDDKFYLIDANPTDLSSIHFDANKLRQDIDSFWFVRDKKPSLELRMNCLVISKELKKRFTFMKKDTIFILMLSRILPYTKEQKTEIFTNYAKW